MMEAVAVNGLIYCRQSRRSRAPICIHFYAKIVRVPCDSLSRCVSGIVRDFVYNWAQTTHERLFWHFHKRT